MFLFQRIHIFTGATSVFLKYSNWIRLVWFNWNDFRNLNYLIRRCRFFLEWTSHKWEMNLWYGMKAHLILLFSISSIVTILFVWTMNSLGKCWYSK
jgi:hypothetical protein